MHCPCNPLLLEVLSLCQLLKPAPIPRERFADPLLTSALQVQRRHGAASEPGGGSEGVQGLRMKYAEDAAGERFHRLYDVQVRFPAYMLRAQHAVHCTTVSTRIFM